MYTRYKNLHIKKGWVKLVKLHIRENAYYDSVTLMLISRDLKDIEGVKEALVGMGTDLNKEISRNIGLDSPELEALTNNDFFVAVDIESDEIMDTVLEKVDELLNKKKAAAAANYYPPTLDSALKIDPELNMAVVSIPGEHAPDVVDQCLDNDINVILFSDNVSIEDEIKLKKKAVEKELLMMGPDCGTAIINGVPLAFANVVNRGDIGIVAASGTGTQEISTIIDQLGKGVSQVIGTGGRDLSLEVGGLMFSQGLEALANDDDTKVIVLISKPPAKEIQTKILTQAKECGKPVVVSFLGGDREEVENFGLVSSVSLEDAARKAVALSKGEQPVTFDGFTLDDDAVQRIIDEEGKKFADGQKYLRGLYTGGTICDEAMQMLIGQLENIYSNIPLIEEDRIDDVDVSQKHTCLDFGNDEFTVGRPHPMIDPSLREARIIAEGKDPETAVILVDCVIGYGAHPDPATDLGEAIKEAKKIAKDAGRHLTVVASVCGTENDPQVLSKSRKALEDAGAIVMPSNSQAVRLVGKILKTIE